MCEREKEKENAREKAREKERKRERERERKQERKKERKKERIEVYFPKSLLSLQVTSEHAAGEESTVQTVVLVRSRLSYLFPFMPAY